MPYKDKEKQKEYQKQWRQRNKEKVREINKHWRKEHLEKVREIDKNWQQRNPEKVREISKHWKQRNSEKVQEYNKKWQQENKEYYIQWQQEHPDRVREIAKKSNAKRHRNLGFIPLNKSFEGSEAHHIDRNYIIYIPKEIHRSIWHSVLKNKNMDEINAVAFNYL